MKIAVTIETKDRRLVGQQNYVGETLRNLARSRFWQSPYLHSLQIVSGGEQGDDFLTQEIGPNLQGPAEIYLCPDGGRTRQQNGAEAIRVGANTDADYVLKLEDDLDFCHDFLGSAARWLSDHSQFMVPMFVFGASFETVSGSKFQEEGESIFRPGPSFPRVRQQIADGRRAVGRSPLGFWAAQALAWRRADAVQLAAWLGPDPFFFDGKAEFRERGHDLLLQIWGQSIGARSYACTVPSFVQHIGLQSNIGNPFFEFPFAGRDWSYGIPEEVR